MEAIQGWDCENLDCGGSCEEEETWIELEMIQTRGPLQPGTARRGRRNNPSTGHRLRGRRQQGRFRWLLLAV